MFISKNKKINSKSFIFILILVIFILIGLNLKRIIFINYIKSDIFANSVISLEMQINGYEKTFYKSPANSQSFKNNLPEFINGDSTFGTYAEFLSKSKIDFKTTDSNIILFTDFFNNKNKKSNKTYYFKDISYIDALFLNGIIIIDTLKSFNKDMLLRPPLDLFFIKNGIVIWNDTTFYNMFNSALKVFSIKLIREFNLKKSKFNRIKYIVDKDELLILDDKSNYLSSNPKVIDMTKHFLSKFKQKLTKYDEIIFSLYLFPEITPATARKDSSPH